jgi:RNA polymerase sigma-32 factor
VPAPTSGEARAESGAPPARGEPALVPHDALSRYFAETSRYPLLSREEEHELAVRVHEHGDREAAEKLVLSNLRLVVKIAREYRRVWANLLDLIQEGNVGLLQAVRRFDPYRGVKLSSYGAYWIRAYILKYLIDNIRMVRVGSSRAERKLFFQLNRARRELERQGIRPEPKLLAERLDVGEKDVVDMQRRLAESDLSLDAPVGGESEGAPFGDFFADGARSTEQQVGDDQMRRTLLAHVGEFARELGPREQRILRARILAEEPLTLQEIGDEFSLTRERVRQLEAALVRRLREYLQQKLVDFEYWAPED